MTQNNYETLARVKHEAGLHLLSVASSLRNMEHTLKANGCDTLMINERYKVSVQDAINSAMNSLDEVHKIFIKYENL